MSKAVIHAIFDDEEPMLATATSLHSKGIRIKDVFTPFPVHGLALAYDNFWCTVGVHPDNENVHEPTMDELLEKVSDSIGRQKD